MLKAAAVVLAFAICALAGAERAARLGRRHAALAGTLAAGERVFSRVTAMRLPLLAAIAAETDAPVFAAFSGKLGEGKEASAAAREASRETPAPLSDADRAAVAALLTAFSATDTASLKRRYEQATAALSACTGEAEHDKREKAKLYRAMGVLVGAAAAILLW